MFKPCGLYNSPLFRTTSYSINTHRLETFTINNFGVLEVFQLVPVMAPCWSSYTNPSSNRRSGYSPEPQNSDPAISSKTSSKRQRPVQRLGSVLRLGPAAAGVNLSLLTSKLAQRLLISS